MPEQATAAEKARALLEKNTGSPIERAQVLATLAVADAIDQLTAVVGGEAISEEPYPIGVSPTGGIVFTHGMVVAPQESTDD